MQSDNVTDVKQRIVQIVRENLDLPHYRILLFGSRANGKAHPRSDIDIGIDAGTEIPLAVINDLKERFDDIPIFQKVDVVDLSTVSEAFKNVALKEHEVIYEQ